MNKFLCIDNKSTNPYFNLALEEYLLKNYSDDIFMLWQNEPSIVVGKHQNTLAEINHHFIKKNQIKVARRLSGGGTVYHDLGNLNFTYIMNGTHGSMVNFAKYTDDILYVLNNLEIPAERNQRNDLHIEGKKISGNAEHVFKNRIIHHGTLLFNTDLDRLNEAISIEPGKYEDKAVQSYRSKVTNISNYLEFDVDIEKLKELLMNFVLKKYTNSQKFILNDDEYELIKDLKVKKYESWNWIYGYSPKFKVNKSFIKDSNELILEIFIKKGIIEQMNLKGNLLDNNELKNLTQAFVGLTYDYELIHQLLFSNLLILPSMKLSNAEILNLLF